MEISTINNQSDQPTVLVTGSTSGIGKRMAEKYASKNYHVIVHWRNEKRGTQLRDKLSSVSSGTIEFYKEDFSNHEDVFEFATRIKREYDAINILHNNAGGYFSGTTTLETGIDYTFAVNHLAPFVLTGALQQILTDNARVITTASEAHRMCNFNINHLQSNWSASLAYARSKLANILFTKYLDSELQPTQSAYCFHPGIILSTDLYPSLPGLKKLGTVLGKTIFSTIEDGAETGVWLGTTSEQLHPGGYFSHQNRMRPRKLTRNTNLQEMLWNETKQLSGFNKLY